MIYFLVFFFMDDTTTTKPAETPAVEPVTAPPAEEKTPEPKGVDPLTEPYLTNPFFYEVANYFGIEQGDYDTAKEKLAAIVDWAYNETKSKDTGDLLLKIREMEDTVQPAEWGEKRYNNLYKYVRLASQKQSVEKAMKSLERAKVGEKNE